DGLLIPQIVQPQHLDLPAVPADQVENALDGGGLARAVLPDQAHDGAAGHGEGHVVQLEGAVILGEMGHFQCVFHTVSSPYNRLRVSVSSERVRPAVLAMSTAWERCSSARRRASSRASSAFWG